MSDRTPPADKEVKRVVLCSGKVGYDLIEARDAAGLTDTTVIRIEQLYPFPGEALAIRLKRMPKLEDVVWAQERSEEHTSELQSLMRISYAVFCLKKKKKN